MNSLTTPQLLFLATAIILAHLWHRRWFLTTHVSPLPDNASAGLPSRPAVDSQNRAPFDILHPNPTADTDEETTQAEVDIIAVHGLGSNVDWSWTWKDKARPGSPVNWLRDPNMLPRVIPKSRIMVYNYESRWHVNAPRTRLQLCGEELVRNLHAFRKGLQDRPVIFVGHSLGGLVIQHALLFADREDEFRYLPRHTSGFIALGSPFRGTKMHGVANFVARLLFLVGSHRGVLEALGYDNQLLRDKLQEFCRLRESTSIPTCCFFEAYDTDYGRRFGLPGLFRGMVVPEESACVPGWERSQLQTDHLKLNKFSGPLDRSFLAVSRQIFTMCNAAKSTVEDIAVSPRQHWMVPFERNEGFVGREDVLRLVLDRISPSANKDACQRTVIQGLGGIGKTQIALEVAFRLRDADPSCSVFWVPAVDATTFENAYRDIGQRLGVAGLDDDKADVKALVQAAISREDAGQWLLIIDNADDPELMFGTGALACHLPCSTKGSILFTTRTREVTNQLDIYAAGIIEPTKMKREEAREMLQARLREDQVLDRASTDSLLDFLDDLPLAIRQASAYMFKTGISTARYLKYCLSSDATLVKLLSREFEDRGRYDRIKNPVATTWLISFEHISRDSRRAGEYLEFMCFLAERDIPISLLPPASDEMETEEAVGTLEAYGFITRREEGESLDMHRLVRLAMWNWLRQEEQARQRYCDVVQRLDEVFPFPKHENREIWMRYMAHAQRVVESDEECEDEGMMLRLLFNVAEALSMQGRYEGAAKLYRETLEAREKVLGKEHLHTLGSMNNLASVLGDMGEYEEAEKMYRETLEAMEKALGKEHPSTLDSMNNLASVLGDMGEYEEAEKMHRETLELMEKVLGKEHPHTLGSMNNLANLLDNMGEYKESEKMHREMLELREKVLGKEHPSTLDSMNNLATVLGGMGEYEEAEKMYRETLEAMEKVLGKEHPSTLGSMNNLATVLGKMGEYEEAEKIHRETLELKEKVLGKEHPSTLDSMNNLANVLNDMDEYEEAEKMHRETLEAMEKALGKEHPSTLGSMNNLANLLDNMGEYEEAEKIYRETLELKEKVLGKEHPSTLSSMNNLANLLDKMGEYEEAEKIYREMLELKEKVLGKEHPSTLGSMNNLATVLDKMGEYEEAEKIHRETLELKEKVLGKEHPATLISMNNLALVLKKIGKYEEAEKIYRETLEAREKVLGKEHPSTLDSMNNLALVLRKIGKYEEAEKMHREEWKLTEKVLGKEHPSTLDSMNDLASVLDNMGEYEEAEKMHRETLEAREKLLGKEHPDTLISMNNLANVLDKMGEYEEAEKMHRETLEARVKLLGKEHPDTLDSMNNLALVLRKSRGVEAEGGGFYEEQYG